MHDAAQQLMDEVQIEIRKAGMGMLNAMPAARRAWAVMSPAQRRRLMASAALLARRATLESLAAGATPGDCLLQYGWTQEAWAAAEQGREAGR